MARRLQESGILPGVPLIITIALDAQTIAESLNATAVLNKPFNIESILSTVNGALATASKE